MNEIQLRMIWVSILVLIACTLQSLHANDLAPEEKYVIKISLKAPNPNWTVQIQKVYRAGDDYWVYSHLTHAEGMAPQVIVQLTDKVSVIGPQGPLHHIATGKTWGWGNGEGTAFPDSEKAALKLVPKDAELVFSR